MLKEKRNEIVELFKKNIGKYISQEDLQEIITSITYLFWNAKFVMKNDFEKELNNNDIDCLFQKGNENNQSFIINICNSIRMNISEINMVNIVKYLNKMNEDEIVEVISEDYEIYSRFSFSTPATVSELAIKILEQANGDKVLDLCSYVGNFLTKYASKYKKYNYTGIEISYHDNILTEEKLSAQNVLNNIISANVLGYKFSKSYDKIFCNYPFALRLEQKDYDAINKNNKKLDVEFSKRITSDWAFVSSILNGLAEKGKAVTIMPNGGLYKLTDLTIRKDIVEKGYVEAVISLPGNIFNNTMIETTLLVLSNGNKRVKFINASSLCEKEENKNKLDVEKIYNEYSNVKDSDITKTISIKEIEKMSYSLLANNYMAKKKVTINNPKTLSEVAEIFRGYQITSSEINQLSEIKNNVIPCKIINITNLNDGKIDKELTTIYPENDKMNRYLLKNKDILVSAKGTINKFAVIEIKDDEKYIASGNFNIIRLKSNLVNPYYLKMFLESSKGTILLDSIRSGGVLPALNMALFKDMEITVPPIKEQNEAVNKYLAKQDEIEIIKNKLKLLEKNIQDLKDMEF